MIDDRNALKIIYNDCDDYKSFKSKSEKDFDSVDWYLTITIDCESIRDYKLITYYET